MKETLIKHGTIRLGMVGENDARTIVWDISDWYSTYGEGTVTLLHCRNEEGLPYPCKVDVTADHKVKWTVTAGDLGAGGHGKCQLTYTVGEETVAKSPVFRTFSAPSIVEDPDDPPSAAATWVDEILSVGQTVEEVKPILQQLPFPTKEDAGKSIVVSEDGTKYELKMVTGGGGGGESYQIGDGLKIVDGKLTVDVVNDVEKDNTKPITSAAVFTTVGNIDALLQTI